MFWLFFFNCHGYGRERRVGFQRHTSDSTGRNPHCRPNFPDSFGAAPNSFSRNNHNNIPVHSGDSGRPPESVPSLVSSAGSKWSQNTTASQSQRRLQHRMQGFLPLISTVLVPSAFAAALLVVAGLGFHLWHEAAFFVVPTANRTAASYETGWYTPGNFVGLVMIVCCATAGAAGLRKSAELASTLRRSRGISEHLMSLILLDSDTKSSNQISVWYQLLHGRVV